MGNQQQSWLHIGLGIGSWIISFIALIFSFIPSIEQLTIFTATIAAFLGIGSYYIAKKIRQSSELGPELSTGLSTGFSSGGITISIISLFITWFQTFTLNSASIYNNYGHYPYFAILVVAITAIIYINYATKKRQK